MATPQFTIPWDPEIEFGPGPKQLKDVEEYMAGHIDVEACAASLTEPVRAATSQPDGADTMNQLVHNIFSFINSSAIDNADFQPQLLALVAAIQQLPELEVPAPKVDIDGDAITLGDKGERLWEDMPGFGHGFGDDLRGESSSRLITCSLCSLTL
jgi:hypothetical protein